MNRITSQILQDPRFAPIAELAASGASDSRIVEAMEASGMVGEYAYSELAEALRCEETGR
jgi:hypothetical protein